MGRRLKDYSHLIGQKFGDRMILDVISKEEGANSRRLRKFAVCQCKCGRIDEVQLNGLLKGHYKRCKACAYSHISATKNKSTGIKNISYDRRSGNFVVTIRICGQSIIRRARTLDDAILTKKLLLEHFDTYGCFIIEKLNDSPYTRERRKVHRNRDYSYLIGQTLGDWTIVDVDTHRKENERYKYAHLQNSAGDTHKIELYNALRSLQNATRAYRIKDGISNNTGVKYVCYHKKLDHYVVQITRNKIKKTKAAKSLEEAIEIKEQFLKEFENEAKAHD